MDAGPVNGRMTFAAADQPAVGRDRETKAIASANERLPQKSKSPRPAWRAPGIKTMIRLSTISMIRMLSVSEASAIGITVARANPARSSGRLVSA